MRPRVGSGGASGPARAFSWAGASLRAVARKAMVLAGLVGCEDRRGPEVDRVPAGQTRDVVECYGLAVM